MPFIIVLRDHPPLKQGLRLLFVYDLEKHNSTPRPSSTKTRIKTRLLPSTIQVILGSPRPSSTKTRIKTDSFQSVQSAKILSETILH